MGQANGSSPPRDRRPYRGGKVPRTHGPHIEGWLGRFAIILAEHIEAATIAAADGHSAAR